MTRIKICGLTRKEDALGAAEWGADALGFVFAPRSKRRADPETVAQFIGEVPPFVTLVGVFQDQPLSEVARIMRECRLHVAQLHGLEDERFIEELGMPVLKAVGLSAASDVEKLGNFPGHGSFLLDSAKGGSGKGFERSWALEAMRYGRIVLAGGLTPVNVAEAIRAVRPWGVDTASGVESAPGIKDSEKVRSFIGRVRDADSELMRHDFQ
jgi:phosphoribosylanthranilate isomerase